MLFLCAERLDQSAPIINVIERGGDGANGAAPAKKFRGDGFFGGQIPPVEAAAMIAGLEAEDAAAPFNF